MKYVKMSIALILALLILCMAAACQTNQGNASVPNTSSLMGESNSKIYHIDISKEALTNLENYTYSLEEIALEIPPGYEEINCTEKVFAYENTVYYALQEMIDGDTFLTKIMALDLNTGKTSIWFDGQTIGLNFDNFTLDSAGIVWIAYNQNDATNVAPIENGVVGTKVKLECEQSSSLADFIYIDKESRIYLKDVGKMSQDVSVFSEDGKRLADISTNEIGGTVYSIRELSDGIYFVFGALETGVIAKLDEKTFKLGKPFGDFRTDNGCGICSADPIGLKYACRQYDGLYANDEENNSIRLLDWNDYGLGVLYPSYIHMTSTGDIITGNFKKIYYLKRIPKEEGDQRQVLTLATFTNGEPLRDIVSKFNRNSKDYMVSIVDYSTYNTESEPYAGLTKLNTEIIGGNAPDIINLRGIDAQMYIEKGVVEDLAPYLDADPDLSRDDILENVYEAMGDGEKLYGLTTTFRIITMAAKAANHSTEKWNLAGVKSMLQENKQAIFGLGKRDFLRMVCDYMLSNFVDQKAGTVTFDSPEFVSLLEACALLPEATDMKEIYDLMRHPGYPSDYASLAVDNLEVSRDLERVWGEKNLFVGFPESGSRISLRMYLAMSSSGKHKDGVWSFIRTALAKENQEVYIKDFIFGFPSLKSEMDTYVEYLLNPEGEEYLLNGGTGEIEQISFASKEQVQQVIELINNTRILESSNTVITDIVMEEVETYFSGSKAASDVAAIIQNRVTTYINEQML